MTSGKVCELTAKGAKGRRRERNERSSTPHPSRSLRAPLRNFAVKKNINPQHPLLSL